MNFEIVTVREFRSNLSQYLKRIQDGEYFEVYGVKIGCVHDKIVYASDKSDCVHEEKEIVHEPVYTEEELPTERCDGCRKDFSSDIYRVYEEQGEMNICRNCIALKVPPKQLESALKKMESIF